MVSSDNSGNTPTDVHTLHRTTCKALQWRDTRRTMRVVSHDQLHKNLTIMEVVLYQPAAVTIGGRGHGSTAYPQDPYPAVVAFGQVQLVNPGDWVVNEQGWLVVLPDDVFRKKYQPPGGWPLAVGGLDAVTTDYPTKHYHLKNADVQAVQWTVQLNDQLRADHTRHIRYDQLDRNNNYHHPMWYVPMPVVLGNHDGTTSSYPQEPLAAVIYGIEVWYLRVGDWLVYTAVGLRVYTDDMFRQCYECVEPDPTGGPG